MPKYCGKEYPNLVDPLYYHARQRGAKVESIAAYCNDGLVFYLKHIDFGGKPCEYRYVLKCSCNKPYKPANANKDVW